MPAVLTNFVTISTVLTRFCDVMVEKYQKNRFSSARAARGAKIFTRETKWSCHVATFAKDLGEVMSCRVATFARNLETYDINICLNSRYIYAKPKPG